MRPDLTLLDIMFPGESGIEVCGRIREHDQAVVIAILKTGADDYVKTSAARPCGLLRYLSLAA